MSHIDRARDALLADFCMGRRSEVYEILEQLEADKPEASTYVERDTAVDDLIQLQESQPAGSPIARPSDQVESVVPAPASAPAPAPVETNLNPSSGIAWFLGELAYANPALTFVKVTGIAPLYMGRF